MKGRKWRTVRILVEIPVLGPPTDKEVVQAFADSFDHDLPRLISAKAIGRIRIKDYNGHIRRRTVARKTNRKRKEWSNNADEDTAQDYRVRRSFHPGRCGRLPKLTALPVARLSPLPKRRLNMCIPDIEDGDRLVANLPSTLSDRLGRA